MKRIRSYAYLLQIIPVAKIAIYWLVDIFSAGLSKSPIFEIVIIHLNVGAQKNTFNRLNDIIILLVKGPAGWAKIFLIVPGQGIASTLD